MDHKNGSKGGKLMPIVPKLYKIGENIHVYCSEDDVKALKLARIFSEYGFDPATIAKLLKEVEE